MKYKILAVASLACCLFSCSSQNQAVTDEVTTQTAAQYVGADAGKAKAAPAKEAVKEKKNALADANAQNAANAQAIEKASTPKPEKETTFPAPRVPGVKISSVSVPVKAVALTFDDGPHGTLTPRVLNILGRYNAKGTFFLLGSNVERYPSVVQRMVSEGHEVANHSWNHPNLAKLSRAGVESQLTRTNDAIAKACGVTPRIMRPPYGACNSSLCAWMKEQYGMSTILWDVDTNDWRKPGVAIVVSRAVNGAKPGSIILVHDIHASTVDAVEGIVKGLQARGFELVTVSQLMSMGRRYAGQKAAPQTITAPGPVSAPATLPQEPAAESAPAVQPAVEQIQPALEVVVL